MKNLLLLLTLYSSIILSDCRCKSVAHQDKNENSFVDSRGMAIVKPTPAKAIPKLKITYTIYSMSDSLTKAIIDSLSSDRMDIVLALNRVDESTLHHLKEIAIPDTFLSDFNSYSPFPDTLHILDSIRKSLLISYRFQAFAAYENGTLQCWGPNSMGKKSTPTPTGLFFTNWKSPETISTEDSTWILKWYFNIESKRGISFHEFQLPGYPASHSCIRLRAEDAKWIYDWADQWRLEKDQEVIIAYGTPVIIFGSYNYGQTRPWLETGVQRDSTQLNIDSLTAAIQPYLKIILERQLQRDSVMTLIEPL